jgi:hypothetical protein
VSGSAQLTIIEAEPRMLNQPRNAIVGHQNNIHGHLQVIWFCEAANNVETLQIWTLNFLMIYKTISILLGKILKTG